MTEYSWPQHWTRQQAVVRRPAMADRAHAPHGRVPRAPRLGLAVIAALLAGGASTHAQHVGHEAGHDLGTVHFPISCSEHAQQEFDRAVALLHHMTYAPAREAFARVAATDPRCAMAHWGIAMTLFQPLWPTRPPPAALRQGWTEVQRAESLQAPTARERSFVAATAAFFLDPSSQDYWLRIRRWEAAAHETFAAYPDDPDAATFYALALLAAAPSNAASRVSADSAAAILLRVYARYPDHPGAMHYLVHANDVSGREHDSLDIIARYATIAPRNAHALHMPTHIYTRLGDWTDVIRGNLLSEAAALRQPAGDHGEFVSDDYPHAVEYLVYAYLQEGADGEAARQVGRLRATPRLEPTFKTAFHLASTQARYVLERREWSEAASIVPRRPATIDWDTYTWPEAISQFARGLGAAHVGKLDDARIALARLEQLEVASGRTGEVLFTRNIRVLRLEVGAWIAHVDGEDDHGGALMQEAAALEVSTPKPAVTPGPTLPAYELLGDLLMEQRRPADALAAYRQSLALYPRRFNSLLGAARAARALGDTSSARDAYQELLQVGQNGTRAGALGEARKFTGHGPYRFRLMNITVERPGLEFRLVRGDVPGRWVPLAKDAYPVGAWRRVPVEARQPVSIGETYDFRVEQPDTCTTALELRDGFGKLLRQQVIRFVR